MEPMPKKKPGKVDFFYYLRFRWARLGRGKIPPTPHRHELFHPRSCCLHRNDLRLNCVEYKVIIGSKFWTNQVYQKIFSRNKFFNVHNKHAKIENILIWYLSLLIKFTKRKHLYLYPHTFSALTGRLVKY